MKNRNVFAQGIKSHRVPREISDFLDDLSREGYRLRIAGMSYKKGGERKLTIGSYDHDSQRLEIKFSGCGYTSCFQVDMPLENVVRFAKEVINPLRIKYCGRQ